MSGIPSTIKLFGADTSNALAPVTSKAMIIQNAMQLDLRIIFSFDKTWLSTGDTSHGGWLKPVALAMKSSRQADTLQVPKMGNSTNQTTAKRGMHDPAAKA